jgi:hypothetical protein
VCVRVRKALVTGFHNLGSVPLGVRFCANTASWDADNFKKLIEHVEKEGPFLALDLGGAQIGSEGESLHLPAGIASGVGWAVWAPWRPFDPRQPVVCVCVWLPFERVCVCCVWVCPGVQAP